VIPLPNITTPRLYLRPVSPSDAEDIFDYAKRKEVGPNAGWAPHEDISVTRKFVESLLLKRERGHPGVFAVVHRFDEKVVGTIEIHSYVADFKGDLGMVLHPDYWGQGLMLEAAKAVMVYGFEYLGLKRLGYAHFPENYPSKRLREKLGFTFEGIARNNYKRFDGAILDEAVASYTLEDYKRDAGDFHSFKKRISFDF